MSKVKGLKGGEKTKHRVVILGGGYCGAICAFALDSTLNKGSTSL